jgi:hypothetical protein
MRQVVPPLALEPALRRQLQLQCDPVNQSSTSFIGGGQGKRWQKPWVAGMEVSLAYARFHEGSADVNSAFTAPDINTDKTNLQTLFTSTLSYIPHLERAVLVGPTRRGPGWSGYFPGR